MYEVDHNLESKMNRAISIIIPSCDPNFFVDGGLAISGLENCANMILLIW